MLELLESAGWGLKLNVLHQSTNHWVGILRLGFLVTATEA